MLRGRKIINFVGNKNYRVETEEGRASLAPYPSLPPGWIRPRTRNTNTYKVYLNIT